MTKSLGAAALWSLCALSLAHGEKVALPYDLLHAAQSQLEHHDPEHRDLLLRRLGLVDDGGQTSVACNPAVIGSVGSPSASQAACANYVWDPESNAAAPGGAKSSSWAAAGNIDPIWGSYFPQDSVIPAPTGAQLQFPNIQGPSAGQPQPLYAAHQGLRVAPQTGWGGGPNVPLGPPPTMTIWGVHATPSTNPRLAAGAASVLVSWLMGSPSWGVSIGGVGPGADAGGYSLVCPPGAPAQKCALGTLQNTPAPGAFIPAGVSFSATIRVGVSTAGPATVMPLAGLTCLQYLRVNPTSNYLSPYVCHATVANLAAKTTYFYSISATVSGSPAAGPAAGTYSMPAATYSSGATLYKFTTPSGPSTGCPDAKSCPFVYPVPLVLMADVGQTYNSSLTAQYVSAYLSSVPVQAVFHVGDYTYADTYDALNTFPSGFSTQPVSPMKWDSWAAMWQSVLGQSLLLNCAGNHEIESAAGQPANNAKYTDTSTSFGFLTEDQRYPYQAWAARYPNGAQPATSYGDLWVPQYYSQDLGPMHVITLNPYIPFVEGTEQYNWLVQDISRVDRSRQPWLIVQYHVPIYHTYLTHYKEAECFRGVYEPLFYRYRVDFVINGHVHAYERTHPVYNYTQDACGPVHITVGDGGNAEGPYRNYMDEVIPGSPNVTYCQAASAGTIKDGVSMTESWTPAYQQAAQPPTCNTLSFQPAQAGTAAGILPNPYDPSQKTFWCQSAQASWSAYRDPAFGFAGLTLTSDNTATYSWYRNVDQSSRMTTASKLRAADTARYTRYFGPCAASTTTTTTSSTWSIPGTTSRTQTQTTAITMIMVSGAPARSGWLAFRAAFAALACAPLVAQR